jgi:ABC-type lipoprotein release transport system permease subunit
LECRCSEADLPKIRQQIQGILPEAHVIRDMSKANARANQRQMVKEKHEQIIATHAAALAEREQALADTTARREKIESLMGVLANVVNPLVVLACAVWIGLLALANVRERRTEIGILRAIGKGSRTIASLFLGKAVLLGLIGGAVGILLGTSLALLIGERAWGMTADQFAIHYPTLLVALVGAPLLSALASYLPTLSALTQDPAVVLRDQ